MGEIASTLWQLSNRELVAHISASEDKLRRDYAEHLALLAEADARGTAYELGYSNTTALLVHTQNISRREANQRLAHAAALHDAKTPTGAVAEASMPLTAKKLAAGEVCVEQVEVIRKFIGTLDHLEPDKVALAEELMIERAAEDDPNALARYGERWVRDIVDPDGKPPNFDEPQRPERELRRHVYRDGRMQFSGRLDAETSALFDQLLAPFEKNGPDDTRGYAERAGDAFADVLQKAANCPDLPTHNGLKTEVAFTISMDELAKAVDERVLPGTQLTAGEMRRIACDCHVLPAVMGGESKPLDVAVPAYVVPAHIRRGLVLRDHGCAFPGCERPASVCHSHHIRSWLQGGPTALGNLVLLCGHHHRLIHRSEWEVKLVDGVPWFTPPDYVDPERKPRRNHLHRLAAG
ncbi:HNH endonuclease signature motif containing protein [Kibdelosporangium persicum]|uniref:HNH endonuclease n=1 Tax=Kibdelosporangium persicum TaxID=2698649 RepID=A0ABX2EXK3_9PSEU|nr:HNH endonuclease signature motif containing protein [Kibdelosporangium persicum]NRN63729.1 HNH endonuclease [Kibdelosporangium persicum]